MSPFFSALIKPWNATLLVVALVTNTLQVRLSVTRQQQARQPRSGNLKQFKTLRLRQSGTCQLYILADPPHGAVAFDVQHNGMSRGEFHCWVIGVDKNAPRDDLSAHELIDLTSRHYKRMVEDHPQIAESVEIEGSPPVMLLARENRMRWNRDDEPPEFIWTTVDRQPDLIKVAPDEDCCKTIWDMTIQQHDEIRAFQQLCWRHFSKLCPAVGKLSRTISANSSGPVQARQTPRVGRNARCPCGSGKKFKRCCLRNADSDTTTTPFMQANTGLR